MRPRNANAKMTRVRFLACAVVIVALMCPLLAFAGPYPERQSSHVTRVQAARDLSVARLESQATGAVANYAVYSSSDSSLTFLYSSSTPTRATLGKSVTDVYAGSGGWADHEYSAAREIPWWSHMKEIRSVEFRDTTRPCYTAYWFCQAKNTGFTTIDCTNLDMSLVSDASYMFYNCNYLESIDISTWETPALTNMTYMFANCSNLQSLAAQRINTSSVTVMPSLFSGCKKLASLDVSGWDVSRVSNFSSVFNGCEELVTLDVSRWVTSSATYMGNLFYGCAKVEELDLSGFDTSRVYSLVSMFQNCGSLSSITLGSAFDFHGSGISDANKQALFPTPPSGKWASPTAQSTPKYTPEELRDAYDGATMTGVYVWAEVSSNVVGFDANGGEGAMASAELEEGESMVVPASGFVRSGFVFAGWNTRADGTGTAYSEGDSLSPQSDLTLYAQWEEEQIVLDIVDEMRFDLSADGGITGSETVVTSFTNRGNVRLQITGIHAEPASGFSFSSQPAAIGDLDLRMAPVGGTPISLSDYAAPGFAEPVAAGEWVIERGGSLQLTGFDGTTAGIGIPAGSARVTAGSVVWRFAAASS